VDGEAAGSKVTVARAFSAKRPHFRAALRAVSGRDARATPESFSFSCSYSFSGSLLVLVLVLFLFLVFLIVLLLRHSQDAPEHKPENKQEKEYENELMWARCPRHSGEAGGRRCASSTGWKPVPLRSGGFAVSGRDARATSRPSA
jgi:hypothetical protein